MIARRGPGEPGPDLLEPFPVAVLGDHAENARGQVRSAIASGFPLHEDEFNIILDDRVRFIWFSQKTRAVALDLVLRVGDLVPDDRRQIVKTHRPAMFLNRSVKRDDGVSAIVLLARQAHVPDYADQSPPRNPGLETLIPHGIKLANELVIFLDMPQLACRFVVLLQRPVRRRG